MLRAVVFDLDGVIIDSESLHLAAYRAVLAERGLTLSTTDYLNRYLGLDDRAIFRALSCDTGAHWTEAEIWQLTEEKICKYGEACRSGPPVLPGARDCILRLADQVPLAIASGALHGEIIQTLTTADLLDHFDVLVGSDDTPRSKPHPDPYARALEILGIHRGTRIAPNEAVGIEDSLRGLESVRAAGLRAVAVANTYPPDALVDADLIVKSLDEIELDDLKDLCG